MTATCDNCGARLVASQKFCSNCGQMVDIRTPTLAELASDLLDDLFNLDSRLWRSILPLIRRPGFLTVEYLAGKRARYLPPFRMYLVFSLTFFALSSLLSEDVAVLTGEEAESLATIASEATNVESGGEAREFGCEELAEVSSPLWRDRVFRACTAISEDSGGFGAAVQNNVPTMMFLLIPIVAAIMKMIYPLLKRRYIEHLVFCLHLHALFFLVLTLGIFIERAVGVAPILRWPAEFVVAAGGIYLLVYAYMALLRVYRQSRAVTFAKFVLLGGGYTATLFVSFLLTVAYTAIRF